MNYIIVGGSGFIGTHLAGLLREGNPTASIYNIDILDPRFVDSGEVRPPVLKSGQKRDSVYVEADVRKPLESLPFTPTPDDVIFNLAAVHRSPGHREEEYFETNVNGAINVCRFAEASGITNIVFVSSIDVYGPSEEVKDETSTPMPTMPYGRSKVEAEKINLDWQKGDPGKRRLTIVRPGVVFGKGENGNFTRLYKSLHRHRFAYPGRKDTVKSCIYVKDLARFLVWAAHESKPGTEIYNCCYPEPVTVERIVGAMKKTTHLSGKVPNLPNAVIMPLAYMAKAVGSPLGICPQRVRKLQISKNINSSKMVATGFELKYPLEEAIVDWYTDNDNLSLE